MATGTLPFASQRNGDPRGTVAVQQIWNRIMAGPLGDEIEYSVEIVPGRTGVTLTPANEVPSVRIEEPSVEMRVSKVCQTDCEVKGNAALVVEDGVNLRRVRLLVKGAGGVRTIETRSEGPGGDFRAAECRLDESIRSRIDRDTHWFAMAKFGFFVQIGNAGGGADSVRAAETRSEGPGGDPRVPECRLDEAIRSGIDRVTHWFAMAKFGFFVQIGNSRGGTGSVWAAKTRSEGPGGDPRELTEIHIGLLWQSSVFVQIGNGGGGAGSVRTAETRLEGPGGDFRASERRLDEAIRSRIGRDTRWFGRANSGFSCKLGTAAAALAAFGRPKQDQRVPEGILGLLSVA
ncbi:hypothetical protein DFH07DRAFT_778044 [Mycena maculata]|uniref:Uncharacterized protein n=1 Tax=Mycena maculata TaxID=230809 RepID=A0AAD7IH15_9AGAR|nr:hypothetical protein DFH07DRAFT_778044 [Mycena maculata]